MPPGTPGSGKKFGLESMSLQAIFRFRDRETRKPHRGKLLRKKTNEGKCPQCILVMPQNYARYWQSC
jgi:hypothetical protein